MTKLKTHQGIAKRLKKTQPKRGRAKLTHQSKGRGSKHLKTKQTNQRKRRIRRSLEVQMNRNLKRIARQMQ